MARIRSIRPEFWKSEAIAALPFRDRLTFIGLWSYVDDNGVGIDNYKLIAAELYGLEDDPREVRDNTRECLARLAARNLISRYSVAGRDYLYVNGWKEHQRVDRPNKPRYPLPSPEDMKPATALPAETPNETAQIADTRDTLATHSRDLRDWRRGEGEKGRRGKTAVTRVRARAAEPPPDDAAEPGPAETILAEWKERLRRPVGDIVAKVGLFVYSALAEGHDPEDIRETLRRWDAMPKSGPALLPSLLNEVANRTPCVPGPRSGTVAVMATPGQPGTPQPGLAQNKSTKGRAFDRAQAIAAQLRAEESVVSDAAI